MDWIGEKEAKAAAKKGKEAALDCTTEHWRQLSHRPKSVFKAREKRCVDIFEKDCALCYQGRKKTLFDCTCPAGISTFQCCGNLWKNARVEWDSGTGKSFTKAAKEVYKFLKGLKK